MKHFVYSSFHDEVDLDQDVEHIRSATLVSDKIIVAVTCRLLNCTLTDQVSFFSSSLLGFDLDY
jgi:hypothetical protein